MLNKKYLAFGITALTVVFLLSNLVSAGWFGDMVSGVFGFFGDIKTSIVGEPGKTFAVADADCVWEDISTATLDMQQSTTLFCDSKYDHCRIIGLFDILPCSQYLLSPGTDTAKINCPSSYDYCYVYGTVGGNRVCGKVDGGRCVAGNTYYDSTRGCQVISDFNRINCPVYIFGYKDNLATSLDTLIAMSIVTSTGSNEAGNYITVKNVLSKGLYGYSCNNFIIKLKQQGCRSSPSCIQEPCKDYIYDPIQGCVVSKIWDNVQLPGRCEGNVPNTCLINKCVQGSCNQVSSGVCTPGQTKTEACGNCGAKTVTCSNTCAWEYGVCTGEGPCAPNQADSQSCGNCGTQARTCQSNCQWGSWGGCSGEGVCAPGLTQSCGNCGTRACQSNCQWSSTCSGQGVCASGQTQSQACGNCGTQQRVCNNCQWVAWGTCSGQGVCTPGYVDTTCAVSGIPGQRTCQSNCQYGSCATTGDCVPGNTRTCGLCGSQTCPASGKWADSDCANQKECTPGQTKTVTSSQGCQHTLTCGNDCKYPTGALDECTKGDTLTGCYPQFSIFSVLVGGTGPGYQLCQADCTLSKCMYSEDVMLIEPNKASFTTVDPIEVIVKTGIGEGESIQGKLECTSCTTPIVKDQTAFVYWNQDKTAKETVFTFDKSPKGTYKFTATYKSLVRSITFDVFPVFKTFEIRGSTDQSNAGPIKFSMLIADENGRGLSQEKGDVELKVIPKIQGSGTFSVQTERILSGSITIEDHRDGNYDVFINTQEEGMVTVYVTASSPKYGIVEQTETYTMSISGARIYIDISAIPRAVKGGDIVDLVIKTKTPTEPRQEIEADSIKIWLEDSSHVRVNEWYASDMSHQSGTGTYTIYGYKFSASSQSIELWSLYIVADAIQSRNLDETRIDGLGISVNPGNAVVTPSCEADSQCPEGFVCRAAQCAPCRGLWCTNIDVTSIILLIAIILIAAFVGIKVFG